MVLLCLSFSVEPPRDVPARRVGRGRARRPITASETRPGLHHTTTRDPTITLQHTTHYDVVNTPDQFVDADVDVSATQRDPMEASLSTSVSRRRQWLQQIAESTMWAEVCIEHDQPCVCNTIPADSSFWTEVLVFEPVQQSSSKTCGSRARPSSTAECRR